MFCRYLAVVCSFVLSSCRGKGGGRSSAAAAAAATAAAAAAAPCFGWSGLCLLCFSVVGVCCLMRTAASFKAHSYTCSILHFPVCSRISAALVAAAAATAVAVLLEVLATCNCNNHTGKSRPHRFRRRPSASPEDAPAHNCCPSPTAVSGELRLLRLELDSPGRPESGIPSTFCNLPCTLNPKPQLLHFLKTPPQPLRREPQSFSS